MSFELHILILGLLTFGAGYLMIVAGLQKSALEWRRRQRRCPACGRAIESRVCPCSS